MRERKKKISPGFNRKACSQSSFFFCRRSCCRTLCSLCLLSNCGIHYSNFPHISFLGCSVSPVSATLPSKVGWNWCISLGAVPAQFPQQAPTSTFPGLSWGEQVPLPRGAAAQLPAAAVQQALVQACAHTCTCRGAGALLRQRGRRPSCQEPLAGPEQGEQGRPRPGPTPRPDHPASRWDAAGLRPSWEAKPRVGSGPVAAGLVCGDKAGAKPSRSGAGSMGSVGRGPEPPAAELRQGRRAQG